MKRFLMMLCLCLTAARIAHAQPKKLLLYIADKSKITGFHDSSGYIVPEFSDAAINTIIGNYAISHFSKAFPLSGYDHMHRYYRIECNSIDLGVELNEADSILFPYYEEVPEGNTSGYTPSDWGGSVGYLEYIHARDAWGITHGHPNTIIGITDTYFETTHDELQSKIANVISNTYGFGDYNHGTTVAGLAAGETDDLSATGFPSIGFDCKLDVSTTWANDYEMLALSFNHRVLNGSWSIGSGTPTYSPNVIRQDIYNEVYDNGCVAVFAAGDGRPTVEGNATNFVYPAALNHNIAVTNVGWQNTAGTNVYNAIDVHEKYCGDSVNTYQHNSRVDICAPSYNLSAIDTNNSLKYNQMAGTSFGSPIVAGTVGLMLTASPYLTPYQVEYLLKKNAYNIYGVSYNTKYAGPTQFTGRLGAGKLEAGATVAAAADFNDYDPATKTLRIAGVDVNTRCAPNAFVNVPKPKLKVKMENGTPPYTFKWEPMPDNTTQFNVFSPLDSPEISSCYNSCLVHYRLTVYDASDIQKVATRFIKLQLQTDSTWDLVMRDAYADMFNERNNMDSLKPKEWNIWESPDLWNRDTNDKITVHENPEYDAGDPNYLYSRIKNIGCAVSPDDQDHIKLNLYWTIASTGETWDMDWKASGPPVNGHQPGEDITGGGVGIPSIKPGEEYIMETAWYPPKPEDYDTAAEIKVCVLGRIEQPGANLGMTFAEDSVTKENVWNNNNIVTRNLIVHNYTANKTSTTTLVGFGNSSSNPKTFVLQVLTGKHIEPNLEGALSKYFTVTLKLGDLYDVWDAGGKQGNPTSYNDITRTVTYDLEQPLRLENIELAGLEKHYIHVTIALKEGISLPYEIAHERIFFRQVIPYEAEIDNGDGTTFTVPRDEVYGSVNFDINVEADEGGADSKYGNSVAPQVKRSEFIVYPNPVKNTLTVLYTGKDNNSKADISVVDVSGKVLLKKDAAVFERNLYRLNTEKLPPGAYFIRISSDDGRSYSMKFIKAEQ